MSKEVKQKEPSQVAGSGRPRAHPHWIAQQTGFPTTRTQVLAGTGSVVAEAAHCACACPRRPWLRLPDSDSTSQTPEGQRKPDRRVLGRLVCNGKHNDFRCMQDVRGPDQRTEPPALHVTEARFPATENCTPWTKWAFVLAATARWRANGMHSFSSSNGPIRVSGDREGDPISVQQWNECALTLSNDLDCLWPPRVDPGPRGPEDDRNSGTQNCGRPQGPPALRADHREPLDCPHAARPSAAALCVT